MAMIGLRRLSVRFAIREVARVYIGEQLSSYLRAVSSRTIYLPESKLEDYLNSLEIEDSLNGLLFLLFLILGLVMICE